MLLGLDVGTTHTKVGVFDHVGNALAHAQALTPRERSADGLEHFAPEPLWQTAAELIRQAVAETGAQVTAVAVSSMGESGVPLDAEGRPTYPIIPWNDPRSRPQWRWLLEQLEPERWFAVTGLYPDSIYTLSKWLWLRQHAPDAWARTRLWLSTMGFVRYRLGGEAAMTDTQAARTMAFDVRRGVWAKELLELAGLDGSFLPPIISGTSPCGAVTPEAAAVTGLAPGTPIYGGGHDHFCAALACGALTPELALDSHGTAEALTVGLPRPPDPSATGGFVTGPHVIRGHSYLEGGVRSAGAALRWAKEALEYDSFEALREAAATVAPGEAPLFIAQLTGAAPPHSDPEATAAFVGVTPQHRNAHFARAVYEGVAFELRRALVVLEQVIGQPLSLVRMAGGSAGDPFWSSIRAAILARPLEVAHQPDMVTLGAALLAGIGVGSYESPAAAVAATYRAAARIDPDPAWVERYQPLFDRYQRTVEALRAARGSN